MSRDQAFSHSILSKQPNTDQTRLSLQFTGSSSFKEFSYLKIKACFLNSDLSQTEVIQKLKTECENVGQ